AAARKLLASQSNSQVKPSSGADIEERTLTKRTVVSSLYASESSSGQEFASVTPFRASSRIAALIEKEKEESSRLREQLKSELLSNIITPPHHRVDAGVESKQPHYEFFGPLGAFLIIILLPVFLIWVSFACLQGKAGISTFSTQQIALLFDVEAALIYLAWFFFQALLAVLPVGCVVEGQPLKSGGRLKYRCNGMLAAVISLLLLGAAVYFQLPVTSIVDKYIGLVTTGIIFSFILSACLFISSTFVSKKKLAPGGCTGNIVYDFFVGRELNPRVGMLDLKFFLELRPGLIGWMILDWILVLKAYQETGTILPSLILVSMFQTLYILDALWFEDAFLTTLEIAHDGCGFLLIFGGLAWMPFFYSLQPLYLYRNSFTLPWYCLVPIALLQIVGFYIYRKSQLEKIHFKRDIKHHTTSAFDSLPTETSRRILISGWWSVCQKPMYLGDLMLTLSWSLTTGFGSLIPYFYVIYLLVFLVYRERRDDAKCRKKYGASWDRYCQQVKYRIVPYIY
ncbi:unnamed protein product, partial [Candidula unifasciata]